MKSVTYRHQMIKWC